MTRCFSIGPAIRKARLDAGISVEQLALDIERTAFSVQSYELNRVEPPLHILARIARSCGVSIGALVDEGVVAC